MEKKGLVKAIGTFILLVILLLAGSNVVFACDCAGPGDTESEYSKASVVFIGKVVGIGEPESGENHKVRFKIIKSYKGIAAEQFEMLSTLVGASCEYPFESNEEYLVYLNTFGERLKASTCGRTRKLSEANQDLEILDKMSQS